MVRDSSIERPRGLLPRNPQIEVKAKMAVTSVRDGKIVTDERWGIKTWNMLQ
jgi:hypothetical protein